MNLQREKVEEKKKRPRIALGTLTNRKCDTDDESAQDTEEWSHREKSQERILP